MFNAITLWRWQTGMRRLTHRGISPLRKTRDELLRDIQACMSPYEDALASLAVQHGPRVAVAALCAVLAEGLKGLVATGDITHQEARDLLLKYSDRVSVEDPPTSPEGVSAAPH